jgi:hypothetical protein
MVVTPDELLWRGLVLVGFNAARIGKVKRSTSLSRFRSFYGSNPMVYAEIWQDLQTSLIPEALITTDAVFVNLDSFLLAICFFKCYCTEAQLAGMFNVCEKTARKCCWFFAKKIQALKAAKVRYRIHSHPWHELLSHRQRSPGVNFRLSGQITGHQVRLSFPLFFSLSTGSTVGFKNRSMKLSRKTRVTTPINSKRQGWIMNWALLRMKTSLCG